MNVYQSVWVLLSNPTPHTQNRNGHGFAGLMWDLILIQVVPDLSLSVLFPKPSACNHFSLYFLTSFLIGTNSEGKEFAPVGANFFLQEWPQYRRAMSYRQQVMGNSEASMSIGHFLGKEAGKGVLEQVRLVG